MANVLIDSTTSATQSSETILVEGQEATIVATGFASGEYGDLQITTDGGATYSDAYDKDGQVRLTDTLNVLRVLGPLHFRIDKDSTASAAKIILMEGNNI